MLRDVSRRIRAYGPLPDDFDERRALRELLASKSLYGQVPENLAAYSFDLLKVGRGTVKPRHPGSLLPPDTAVFLRNFKHAIEKTPEEISADLGGEALTEPYWDPTLRSDLRHRRHLIEHLARLGLVSFRRRVMARVGIFFVNKNGSAPMASLGTA